MMILYRLFEREKKLGIVIDCHNFYYDTTDNNIIIIEYFIQSVDYQYVLYREKKSIRYKHQGLTYTYL